MLFERLTPNSVSLNGEGPSLPPVIDRLVPDGSGQFTGQLRPSGLRSAEAFVVNVLEHALSRDPNIIDRTTGTPSLALERWQSALLPLRSALARGRVTAADTEDSSQDRFRLQRLSYMRNWPGQYRELQQDGDLDSMTLRIRVGALPNGILGGGSLAIASNAPQADRATEFVRFLTGVPAQKILASYAVPATRSAAYEDPDLQTFIPHLKGIRDAVEDARPRPITPRYQEFSEAMFRHFEKFVGGADLSTTFIDDIRKTLNLN